MKRREHALLNHWLLPAYRDAEAFGLARWRREHPKRYMLLIRRALLRMEVPYNENAVAWNEFHHPVYQGKAAAGAYHSIDFLLRIKGLGVVALIVYNPRSIKKPSEQARWQARLTMLEQRSVPFLVLPTHHTSMEYCVIITQWIRKGKNNGFY